MKNKQILEVWASLKDKVGGLVDRLASQKEINQQTVDRYQTRIKQKDQLVSELEEDLRELGGQIGSLEQTISSKENLIRNLESKLEVKEDLIYSLRTQISTLQSKSIDNYDKEIIYLPNWVKFGSTLLSAGEMYTEVTFKKGVPYIPNNTEPLFTRTKKVYTSTRTGSHISGSYHWVIFISKDVNIGDEHNTLISSCNVEE